MVVTLTRLTNPSSGLSGGVGRYAGVSPDGQYVAYTANLAGGPFSRVYKRSGNALNLLSDYSGTGATAASGVTGCNFKQDGSNKLALANQNSPYLRIYRNVSDVFTIENSYTTTPGIIHAKYSRDGTLGIASMNAASPWFRMYKITSGAGGGFSDADVWTALTVTYVGGAPDGTLWDLDISPDNQYVIMSGTMTGFFLVYKITAIDLTANTVTLTKIPMGLPSRTNSANNNSCAFHPSGNYFITAETQSGGGVSLYKFNQDKTSYGFLAFVTNGVSGDYAATARWSKDGKTLLWVSRNGTLYAQDFDAKAGTLGTPQSLNTTLTQVNHMAASDDLGTWVVMSAINPGVIMAWGSCVRRNDDLGKVSFEINVYQGSKAQGSLTYIDPVQSMALDPISPLAYRYELPAPVLDFNLGQLLGSVTLDTDLKANLGFSLGELAMDMFAAQSSQAHIAFNLGKLDSQIIAGPFHLNAAFDLGKLDSVIVAGPFHVNAAFSLGKLDMAANIKLSTTLEIAGQLGAMQLDMLVAQPLDVYVEFNLGALLGEVVLNDPVGLSASFSLGKLDAEIDLNNPWPVTLGFGLGALQMDLEGKMPDLAYAGFYLGELSADVLLNNPEPAYVAMSLGKLDMVVDVNAPNGSLINMSLGKLDMSATMMLMNFLDFIGRLGKLDTYMLVAEPVSIDGEVVMPLPMLDGNIIQTNAIEGEVVMPLPGIEGQFDLVSGVRGEIVMPMPAIDGEIYQWNGVRRGPEFPPPVIDGEIGLYVNINGEVVMPLPVISGSVRNGDPDTGGIGDAPSLLAPTASLAVGGGVFFGTDTITVG